MTPEQAAVLLSIGEREPIMEIDARAQHLSSLSGEMGDAAPEKDEPVREIVARLGDNWSSLILKVLAGGEFRHATLKRVISELAAEGDISQRMLTLRLRALERDGLVARREEPMVPPRVFYRLTELGAELNQIHSQIIGWITENEKTILKARAEFNDQEQ